MKLAARPHLKSSVATSGCGQKTRQSRERESSLTIIENSIGQAQPKKSNVWAINTSNNICKVIAKRISGIGDHWNKPETPRERLPV